MTKYFFFTIGSFGYLSYLFIMSAMHVGQYVPRPDYNLISPFLLAVAAGLFILGKSKSAGIVGLCGLAISSKDILSNWSLINVLPQNFVLQYYAFVLSTTAFLFLLGVIAVKTLLHPDDYELFEVIQLRPKTLPSKILIGFFPCLVVMIATATWLVLAWTN
jgi:hypothetical protein